MLTLSNITVELDKQPILSLGDIALPYGQLNVLAGPSGAGKSTFLHTVSGQLKLTQGLVHWQGQSLFDLNESARSQWRSKNVGFIFQDFHLIPSLSALDNVILQHSFSHWRIPNELRQQALVLLKQFGVKDVHKNIGQFSRGEKQRIALARALSGSPAIILADEPTASLDKENAEFVIQQLKAQADLGKFVLAVSHDPLVIGQASQILYLERGVIQDESMDAA
ncbi:ABC transporter ATP-binding protein [Marinomonas transparens]|uniref:ABC transporter ATP-binding protein n=1 Tax=Marinomonas transparens TaxID=2795388 RepID=A0A934N1C0_9GAMM|nr:ABC transporter ATP-binding protein [Marinomonas transparens]MBJ7539365.1 ABC transporter ATP-binding protein [Marinomonas transparens]